MSNNRSGEVKEGWAAVPKYSMKWHYFVESRSLCRNFGYLEGVNSPLEQGNDDSKDNCAECRKRLEKRRSR